MFENICFINLGLAASQVSQAVSLYFFISPVLQVFSEEERKAFIEDYRLTACMNVLKWFVSTFTEQVENKYLYHLQSFEYIIYIYELIRITFNLFA